MFREILSGHDFTWTLWSSSSWATCKQNPAPWKTFHQFCCWQNTRGYNCIDLPKKWHHLLTFFFSFFLSINFSHWFSGFSSNLTPSPFFSYLSIFNYFFSFISSSIDISLLSFCSLSLFNPISFLFLFFSFFFLFHFSSCFPLLSPYFSRLYISFLSSLIALHFTFLLHLFFSSSSFHCNLYFSLYLSLFLSLIEISLFPPYFFSNFSFSFTKCIILPFFSSFLQYLSLFFYFLFLVFLFFTPSEFFSFFEYWHLIM